MDFNLKIKNRTEVADICRFAREDGKIIGFTSGVFDIFHAGHATYLQDAKKECDILVVALNKDSSVKKNKGPKRPIIEENQRIILLAALSSVDYVYLFEETNNKINIQSLKPHFYFKAGDYSLKGLTSAGYMKEWGGEARLLPVVDGISSSEIISRVVDAYSPFHYVNEDEKSGYFKKHNDKIRPAVFLDRDGTINKEVEYLHEPEKFELLPNAIEGIKAFQDMGYLIIIVTTQAGIGLGYFTKEDFYKVNKSMLRVAGQNGILIEKVYFCPHSKSDSCECRKPETALIERAKEECGIDIKSSFFIGDKSSDILAGQRSGMKTILTKTGHGGSDGEYDAVPDFKAADLLDAANWIKRQN